MNTITLIKGRADWDAFYAYSKGGYKPKKYPEVYPCFAKKETEEGGLGGGFVNHYVCQTPYFAETMTEEEIFLAGLNAEWKCILSA